MKLLKFLTVVGISILAACEPSDKEEQGVKLSGTVNDPNENGVITLSKLEAGKRNILDTLQLDAKNTFETYVKTDAPEFYQINFYNTNIASVVVDDEDLTITANGSKRGEEVIIEGSKDAEYMNKIREMMSQQNEEVQKMNAEFMKARKAEDEEKMKNLQDDYMLMMEKKKEKLKTQINEMLPSIAVIQAMNFFNPNEDYEFMSNIAEKLYEAHPNSSMTQHYKKQMDDLGKVAVGQPAPDFAMPTPEGDTVKLSDFRGNYVLVDFWAAWCKPCRQENPNIVAAYNKFKDEGFQILGVSLDRKREDWLKAIEQDNLEWTQVSELKYWRTPVVQEYKINGIPFSVLVGPEGKIVAKNLRGEALHKKLEEIYGS